MSRASSLNDKSTPLKPGYPNLEFHVRRGIVSEQKLALPLFMLEKGHFRIDFNEVQNLAYTLNEMDSELNLQASELQGLGILTLISHKIIRVYRNQVNPTYIELLTDFLTGKFTAAGLDTLLTDYLAKLPSASFIRSKLPADEYLNSETNSIPNRHVVVEEFLVYLLALNNTAFDKYKTIFKEPFHPAIKDPKRILASLREWSDTSPVFGKNQLNIIDLLVEPSKAEPESIIGQLEYVRANWTSMLGSQIGELLKVLDHYEEEHRFRGGGAGESQTPNYSDDLLAGESYSEDSDWMPRVVMIARNSLVWLDQLSKKYKQDIKTLQDIPDHELDLLASQGFNVLWLIGLWHRSTISKKIKHWCGNPDAESSAYSLKDYQIDPSIGGAEALDDLKRRAWERGIRLASDMVPNHTGLDSDWLKEHPDWFISTAQAPFPAYQFEGGNLSDDPDLYIQLEDHYYDRSDASVVFKYQDLRNGQTRYVYHGNDGTSMPWNDTAQLNYLNPELREAVIQTILEVARKFKVIRFDAAMTLAKRHIQRLWYPEPGSGGDIPSRSNFSMSGAEFDTAIPVEFWREVVDRVSREVPDTLLLAEAFWMMEGYFVRTLGMHRVYNSAFMNMLKMEENLKFFEMIATTLEFDPRILQRFVNFLSNPDEDTAIAQFGKGDKYFGATILMVTLPGLPMFAHAQIEGFEEKYGMEYRRAYWDETPDQMLIARHERLIFPLMKKRYLFAGASNFRLFPMLNASGQQLTDVFAYTNRNGTERALILVNNSYESQAGWIKTSTLVNREPTAENPELESEDLIYALSFDVEDTYFVIFQNQTSKLWYIRTVSELREQGMYLELQGYESQVFLNFQLVSDTQSNPWSSIYHDLDGNGITDFAPLFRSIELEPVKSLVGNFLQFMLKADGNERKTKLFPKFAPLFESLLEIENILLMLEDIEAFSNKFTETFDVLLQNSGESLTSTRDQFIGVITMLLMARYVRNANPASKPGFIQIYELASEIEVQFKDQREEDLTGLIAVLEYTDYKQALLKQNAQRFFSELFMEEIARKYFLIHLANGVEWFNQERMIRYLEYFSSGYVTGLADDWLISARQAFEQSQYRVADFISQLKTLELKTTDQPD